MQIEKLWLINFRNYLNNTIEFAQQNLIVGPNGAGKTNILESIDIISSTKSKIVKGINKCIHYDRDGFIINARFSARDNLQVSFKQERNLNRVIKVNDEIFKKSSELIGKVNSVIFLPNDIDIIQGSPGIRRKYLDILISQIDHAYYDQLSDFQKVLKQRNELLKNIRDKKATIDNLEPWDKQLVDISINLLQQRTLYVEKIDKVLNEVYKRMGFQNELSLQYKTELKNDREYLLDKYKQGRVNDVWAGHTKFGIHTDDLDFLIDKHRVIDFCSQGQKRLISVSLKSAEAQIKREILNDPPILLIDDVLLELDLIRFNKLIREIAPDSQKIYTVTDTKRFDKDILANMKIIELNAGKII